jgi:hypothetical protein
MRLLWKCVYVDGLPAHLRSVLLVAMGLRNLLLVVALPVWARKAVAAQLRAWQQGISETQACNPVKAAGDAKLVHVLRVFKEVSSDGRVGAQEWCVATSEGGTIGGMLDPPNPHMSCGGPAVCVW